MSDFIPKPGIKIGGLSRKAQKLQALREKAAAASTGSAPKPTVNGNAPTFKATSNVARKTTFQRKAV